MRNKIRIDIIDWNNRFPLDRWWRRKYNIAYLSKEHRKSTFFNQYFEYHEDKVYEEHYKQLDKEESKEKSTNTYIPMSGNWWKGKPVSKREVDDWFKSPV